MPTLRRARPPAPSQPAPAEPGTKVTTTAAKPRRTIPIRAVDTAAEAKRRENAYTPPEGLNPEGSGVDYAAVVKRYEAKVKNPKTAIRARCIQCTNGQMKEVQLCPCTTCALHPFRMGENPFNKRTAERLAREAGADEQDDDEDDDDA